ncbi:hypothetical protein [Clostridium estertheticum]|uniref:hypothetical protein n=1 Tax=Clostridium estertheticum TaxID=238834 RepID=UPI001C7D431C|nr:hypothetical protein [Clostridium estertheticum]MBX4272109.1 hypothetical protein [Clostridium estertheticum]WLC78888.1 hypothetical protein KTC98_17085 [Clostridium estertheticum]
MDNKSDNKSLEEVNKSIKNYIKDYNDKSSEEVEKSLEEIKKCIEDYDSSNFDDLKHYMVWTLASFKIAPKIFPLLYPLLNYSKQLNKEGKNKEEIRTLMHEKFGSKIDEIDKSVKDTFEKFNLPVPILYNPIDALLHVTSLYN